MLESLGVTRFFNDMESLYKVSLLLITMSFILFFFQNLILAKFLQSTTKIPYILDNSIYKKLSIGYKNLPLQKNFLFLYPLSLAMYLLLYIICKNNGSYYFMEFHIDNYYLVYNNSTVWPELTIDTYNSFFLFTTILVGIWANLFSTWYMNREVFESRFFLLLNGFMFSMILLLMSSNFVTLLFFWEMIGFTSFFLINFYSAKGSTFKSAKKAFIYNQVSDINITLGIFLYHKAFSTFRFPNQNVLDSLNPELDIIHTDLMLYFFFIAASIKSVQIF